MSEENMLKGVPTAEAVPECPDLESMMRTYGNDVLRTAYMYVKDIHTAEDIFQEVFIKADRNKEGFRGESSVKTWLIRITVNACKDYLKSAYNRRVTPLQEFQENAMPLGNGMTLGNGMNSENDFDRIERKETQQEVRNAVMSLPEAHRDVVLCVYFQGMTVPEAAKALGLAEGTVKSRLSRAKDKLKQLLEGM